MAFDFKNIPFLKDVDLKDPEKRRNFLMLVLMLIVVVVLVIVLVANLTSSPDANAKEGTQQAVPPSEVPDVPVSVDRESIDGKTTAEIRSDERNRQRAGDFARRMFLENTVPDSEDILSGMSADSSARGAGEAPSSSGSGNPIPSMSEVDALTGVTGSEPAQGAASSSASEGASQASSSAAAAVTDPEAARRLRLIELGYDPDTGLPLESRTATPQASPEASAVTPADTGTSAAETTEETSAEPAETRPRITVRSSGAMSPFGTGSSEEGGFSSFGAETTSDLGDETPYFKVAFKYDEKVRTGQRVTLELGERITVNGKTLPINTVIYAICSISGNRLLLNVNNITVNGKAVPLNYEAVDVDWEEGLYCPQSRSAATVKEVAQQAGQVAQQALQTVVGGVPGRLVTVGASAVSGRNGEVTVSVTKGYTFYLMPAPDRSGR